MHSMSGAGGGGGGGRRDHGLYGDHHPHAGFLPFNHDDVDSVFFQPSACGAGAGGDTNDGLMTTPYSSITDYLQGFLDPAGLASHLDASLLGDDAAVKRESASVDVRQDVLRPQAAPPLTPNSSVLSSTSSEAAGDQDDDPHRCEEGRTKKDEEEEGEIDEEGSAGQQNFRRKAKKLKGEKKPRGSRVAFMTKSEVDHLEDSYRWRKYGQKAVKHSSYPRSYYRCTAPRCGVKKLVERSHQDPSTVITTYEGHHTHPSPVGNRGAGARVMLMQTQGAYSLAAPAPGPFQHGFADAYARMYMPGAPAAVPPQQHLFAEYGRQDLLPSAAGNWHGRC